jgi:hypothetical protein
MNTTVQEFAFNPSAYSLEEKIVTWLEDHPGYDIKQIVVPSPGYILVVFEVSS